MDLRRLVLVKGVGYEFRDAFSVKPIACPVSLSGVPLSVEAVTGYGMNVVSDRTSQLMKAFTIACIIICPTTSLLSKKSMCSLNILQNVKQTSQNAAFY